MMLDNTRIPANPFAPNACEGKVAVVTGASSGIGRFMRLLAVPNVFARLKQRPERIL